MKIFVRT